MYSENRRTYAFAAIERQVKDNLMRDILAPRWSVSDSERCLRVITVGAMRRIRIAVSRDNPRLPRIVASRRSS